MIHRIRQYIPDGKIYIERADYGIAIAKTVDTDFTFSIDFEKRIGKSPEKHGMMLHLKRMLQ